MRSAAICVAIGLLALSGCKKDEQGPGGEPQGEREGDERGERGEGPGGDDDGPQFPPPGAEKAPPPPGVEKVMSSMMNAFNAKDPEEVKRYFISRQNFEMVSDCDPPDVVDRVMEGGQQAAERAKRDGGKVTFKGFGDGYLIEVAKGDKPAECRAKMPVGLYMTKYTWDIGGRQEEGEAHFLRVGSVWYFVKL